MAIGKELRTQIASIKNTQKITRAMEMVAASKMRKTKDRMHKTRPYAQKIRQIIKHLAHANPEYKHQFLIARKVKSVGVIIVTSDRGLCGGLNSNLFKIVLKAINDWDKNKINVDICTIGGKGSNFFSNLNVNLVGQITKLGDTPHIDNIIGIIKIMLDAYENKSIDELHLFNNEFVNTMTQQVTSNKLLPIVADKLTDHSEKRFGNKHWDYIYEPDAKEVLDTLLNRYIESIVYQGVVENNACEQAARMVAMKSASDNAGSIIDELQLIFNKTRQATITQEISEIVAGASAV